MITSHQIAAAHTMRRFTSKLGGLEALGKEFAGGGDVEGA